MLINIIHPYTFKLTEDTFQIGPCEEYEERDQKVATFVKEALSSEAKVLWHKCHDGDPVKYIMHELAFESDPIYEFLFDRRVNTVTTTIYGTPLPDDKPEGIPEEQWSCFREMYTSHSELRRKIGSPGLVFFIGGVLENCIANAAVYFHQHYRRDGQQLLYLPELCVSQNPDLLKKIESELKHREINPISYEKALELVRKRNKKL